MKKLCLLVLLAACGNKSKGAEPPAPTPPDAGATAIEPDHEPDHDMDGRNYLQEEIAAFDHAKPVFVEACARCHTHDGAKASAKKLEHFDMTTYPFAGHHVATITATLRHVVGLDGSKPKMPADKPGSVNNEDLAAIAAWADAYDLAEQYGFHEGLPGYTPAE